MTMIDPRSEWTAAGLRPVARWVPVRDACGRTRLEMSWSVPTVEVPASARDDRSDTTTPA